METGEKKREDSDLSSGVCFFNDNFRYFYDQRIIAKISRESAAIFLPILEILARRVDINPLKLS
jgi:hypothetical protein